MKKPSVILLLSFSSLICFAQVERAPAKQPDSLNTSAGVNKKDKVGMKEIMKDLDLTKEQRGKLKEIRQAGKAKKEAIENDAQLTEDEKKKQLRELQKEQAKNIQAILTDEQKEKFKKEIQNKRQKTPEEKK